MLILGIDTSCDDTAAAVVENGVRIVSNIVSSQTDIHKNTEALSLSLHREGT